MRDSALRLQDKTILLVGPFNGVIQACLQTLTEFGCDVAFVSHQTPHAARYVDGVNEAREVHPEYGRAVYYHLPIKSAAEVQEVLGQVTNSIGRVDTLIDATPLAWDAKTDPSTAIEISTTLAEKCMPFLLAKNRGRMIFLFEDSCLERITPATNVAGCRDALIEKIQQLAKTYRGKSVTINGISVGVTDDFLLKTFPKNPSLKKSMEELQKEHPGLKLVEFHDVSLGAAYLASVLSSSVSGQVLRLTHGYHLD